MSEGKSTTDHALIKHWVEERGGRPSRVRNTATKKDPESGILRIDFGEPEPNLERISWDDFFEVFEDRELAFIYQDESEHDRKSYFCKFVHRNSVHA
jgi:hypothetical protein